MSSFASPSPSSLELAAVLRAAPAEAAAVQAELEALHQRSAAAWPGVSLTPLAFAQAMAAAVALREGPLLQRLEALQAADLYLVTAALAGDRLALEQVSERLLPEVCASLRRIDTTSQFADEMAQVLRQRLLLSGEGSTPPPLATYSAQGPLLHWLRAVAVREALKLRQRDQRRQQVESQALAERAPVANLELEIARKLHGETFRAAFVVAFRSLTPRERTLLRMHVLDELTIDQIGAFYKTHRTTAFRWLEAARDALSKGVRNELASQAGMAGHDVESLLGLIRSQLDVSLRSLLPVSSP